MAKKSFELSYKNLERDIERYLDRFGVWDRTSPTPIVYGYDEAQRTVFDGYLQNKAYDAIVHYLLGSWTYVHHINDCFHEVSDLFRAERQINRLTRMWWSVVADQKQFFWEMRAYDKTLNLGNQVVEAKNNALQTMGLFRDILTELDLGDELDRINAEIDALREERRPQAAQKADPRKMDEDLFWGIIEHARETAVSAGDQVASITGQLEALQSSQIKVFQKLLERRMDEALHWDVWALAFVAQDGCSDDAFEAFRGWLILQGKSVFARALGDINTVLDDVPAGLETSCPALWSAAPIAFEARAGKPMKLAARAVPDVKGEPWEEDDLAQRFPKLVRYYDR